MNQKPAVIPGAEAIFIRGGEKGILLCHGFNGTPQSVEDLCRKFAHVGYTVYAPRLNGHGTSPFDMEECTYTDWIQNLEEGCRRLKKVCSKVYAAGQSMGGALTLQLASKNHVDGIILINTALCVPCYEPYQNEVSPRFLYEGKPDIKRENVEEIAYKEVPLKGIHQLQQLMKKTKSILKSVTCPVLLFHSVEDHVVPPVCSEEIFHSVSSSMKKYICLHHSYHVATMDLDQDLIFQETIHFIDDELSNGISLQQL
ncbi:alpha/beta hydrolase [Metabacillus sp. RGM 3146]|uniref:alpha/beta hydrolase n=1 Tax=Metabacillus sp. RGM 3146 TaxID=3401092 RepID=UPI003B9975F5